LTESRKWLASGLQYLLDPRKPRSQWQRPRKPDTPDPIARHRGDAARILKLRFDETVTAGSKLQYIGHCVFFSLAKLPSILTSHQLLNYCVALVAVKERNFAELLNQPVPRRHSRLYRSRGARLQPTLTFQPVLQILKSKQKYHPQKR
jgi:hypothetical protein